LRDAGARRLIGWLSQAYPWVKSFHIVSMVAWMAGLLYLPRLYVYHSMAPVESDLSETFKVMERRLLRGIMTPAMLATWGFGLLLAGIPGVVDWRMGWIWAKLALVGALTRDFVAFSNE
jgi:putative membrane protein